VQVKKDGQAVGIDTTDTVMYYQTPAGKVCVTPSSRTCIYAPRFAAVRQVTGAVTSAGALAPGRMIAPLAAHGVQEQSLASAVAAPQRALGSKQVQLLDRIHDRQAGIPIAVNVPPTPIAEVKGPHTHRSRVVPDLTATRSLPELVQQRIEVTTLINPEAIGIAVDGQQAIYLADSTRPAEVYVYETLDKCSLRLIKQASHQLAAPGDKIRFTLRFENIGTHPLHNAVLVDSLSPRLDYIEGSQQCSLDARFDIQPNDVGSQLLEWEIEGAIAPLQTGVISFDCLVR
jgi:uncharacterized repeat protein (TIGR01451 family)